MLHSYEEGSLEKVNADVTLINQKKQSFDSNIPPKSYHTSPKPSSKDINGSIVRSPTQNENRKNVIEEAEALLPKKI